MEVQKTQGDIVNVCVCVCNEVVDAFVCLFVNCSELISLGQASSLLLSRCSDAAAGVQITCIIIWNEQLADVGIKKFRLTFLDAYMS